MPNPPSHSGGWQWTGSLPDPTLPRTPPTPPLLRGDEIAPFGYDTHPLDPAPRPKSVGVQTELMFRTRRWIAWILLGSLAASPLRAWADGPVRPSLQQPFASPQRPLPSPQGPLPSSQGPKLPIPPGLPRYDLDCAARHPGTEGLCRTSASSSRTGRVRRRASWSSTFIPGTRSRIRIGRSCPRHWRSSGSVPTRRWIRRGDD